MSSMYQLFHLDLKESVENYTGEINRFIEKEFLEELIHETFA
ncbi:hypothetical protein [Streptococcus sp. NLN76]|nr:hypothetical protein [Streptococcus sp. NLN76]